MSLQNRLFNRIDLNDEFRKALGILNNTSSNLFLTGEAGTGKSTFLDYFRSATNKNVVVLAPTGVAALNVKGQTIHSFFHFKPDITTEKVKKLGNFAASMYKSLDTIIIDEISMVRADLLDCIDTFMKMNGKNPSLPFGSVQMVFIGDLYQLPPVVTREEQAIFDNGQYKSQYFFDSNAFEGLTFEFVELKKHYRQSEMAFIELLNKIRNNSATEQHISHLNKRFNPNFIQKDSEIYITLTSTNNLADEINFQRLSRIPEPPYVYKGEIKGEFDKKLLPTAERLVLKEGAQVMLLNNDMDKRWVNGSIGKITEIKRAVDGDTILVRMMDGTEVNVNSYSWELFRFSYDLTTKRLVSNKIGSFTQYPIVLAWAVTIHKSQGKTFEHVIIDVGTGTFAHGQLYVALSRCTTLDGIVLKKRIDNKHIIMDERIVKFLQKIKNPVPENQVLST